MSRNIEVHNKIEQIFSSPAPEINRLAEGFHYILEVQLADTGREMELLQALGDRDRLVKAQIKHSTLQHVLGVFDDCYFRATGVTWQPHKEDQHE
jgi:hypothetical protein